MSSSDQGISPFACAVDGITFDCTAMRSNSELHDYLVSAKVKGEEGCTYSFTLVIVSTPPLYVLGGAIKTVYCSNNELRTVFLPIGKTRHLPINEAFSHVMRELVGLIKQYPPFGVSSNDRN